jgi:hypothetical protein
LRERLTATSGGCNIVFVRERGSRQRKDENMGECCERCDSETLDAEAVELNPNYPLCAECWQEELRRAE